MVTSSVEYQLSYKSRFLSKSQPLNISGLAIIHTFTRMYSRQWKFKHVVKTRTTVVSFKTQPMFCLNIHHTYIHPCKQKLLIFIAHFEWCLIFLKFTLTCARGNTLISSLHAKEEKSSVFTEQKTNCGNNTQLTTYAYYNVQNMYIRLDAHGVNNLTILPILS